MMNRDGMKEGLDVKTNGTSSDVPTESGGVNKEVKENPSEEIGSTEKKEVPEVKIRRAKGSKNITVGICHVLSTFNNTKVTFTDVKGAVISWSSAGRCNFKGSRKSTAYAAQVVTTEAGKMAMGHGLKEISVHLNGPGMGRDAAIRTLQTLGLNVLEIRDVTPIPHNGCRPPKPRRA
jgi:small subunit ribosomal protein S11